MIARRGSSALLVPTLLLALAPKCPLCLLAYLGLAGSVGLSAAAIGAYQVWLAPLAVVSLALTAGVVGLQARARRQPARGWLAALGAATVCVGRFGLDMDVLVYLGIAGLLVAVLPFAWRRPGLAVP